MGRFPWAGSVSQFKNKLSTAAGAAASAEGEKPLENVILHRSLKTRIERLARATANTKSHKAPFRNMMFYGPPGTGKTMVAREIARKSVSLFSLCNREPEPSSGIYNRLNHYMPHLFTYV